MMLRCWFALGTIFAPGCVLWSSPGWQQTNADDQPEPSVHRSVSSNVVKTSSSRILLDVEFIKLDSHKATARKRAQLWNWVDESVLDDGQRRQLFENGLRGGLVVESRGFREHLQSMTGVQDVVDEFFSSASVASQFQGNARQIAMRLGKRYELPLREPLQGSHVTMLRVDDQTIGRTLESPQFLLALQAVEITTEQQLRLLIRPEIQFGQMRQQFVGGGNNSALRIDQRRDAWSIPSLETQWSVVQDQMIVLTSDSYVAPDSDVPAQDASGSFAKQMFVGKDADQRDQQLVLLIRVSRTPETLLTR